MKRCERRFIKVFSDLIYSGCLKRKQYVDCTTTYSLQKCFHTSHSKLKNRLAFQTLKLKENPNVTSDSWRLFLWPVCNILLWLKIKLPGARFSQIFRPPWTCFLVFSQRKRSNSTFFQYLKIFVVQQVWWLIFKRKVLIISPVHVC